MKSTKAAVVQTGSALFDTPRTLDKLGDLLADAARRQARLVVFPEGFVGGYPKGVDFGARVGSRSAEGREWFRRYYESAIDVPGPECDAIGELASKSGTELVVGVIERAGDGARGTLYCSALFFHASGRLVGKRRKLMPTAMERLIWGFGDGSTLRVWDGERGRVAAAICWENYMPLLRMRLYRDHVAFYCAPTVDDRDAWLTCMRHIAYEGRCFVLSACQFARRADDPHDFVGSAGDEPETVLIRGGSCIVDPFGNLLAGPRYGERCILTAELDTDLIQRGKFDLDVAGHSDRPDLFPEG